MALTFSTTRRTTSSAQKASLEAGALGFQAADETGGILCILTASGDGKRLCIRDREIELPVTQITSCAFAGPELDALVVVTAKRLLSPAQRAAQPMAGDVFILRPGAKGIAEPVFG